MSAHRNPLEVHEFCISAPSNGYKILIGAAGMAAHLAGAIKANSILPVIGVPLDGGILTGLDSVLSTMQMPKGVPVATMSVGKSGAINAAILCAEIFALNDETNQNDQNLQSMRELIPSTMDRLHELSNKSGGLIGSSTGYKDLDNKLQGRQNGALIVVAG